jgi:hypothetical protein
MYGSGKPLGASSRNAAAPSRLCVAGKHSRMHAMVWVGSLY